MFAAFGYFRYENGDSLDWIFLVGQGLGCWIGLRMFGVGIADCRLRDWFWIREFWAWFWILEFDFWILDFGFRIRDFGVWCLGEAIWVKWFYW